MTDDNLVEEKRAVSTKIEPKAEKDKDRKKETTDKDKKRKIKFHHCGKLGHVQVDCWVKQPEKKTNNKVESIREDLATGKLSKRTVVVALETQAAISVIQNDFPTEGLQRIQKKTKFWWGASAIVNDYEWRETLEI